MWGEGGRREGAGRGIRQWRGQAELSLSCLSASQQKAGRTQQRRHWCAGAVCPPACGHSPSPDPTPTPRSTDAPSPHCHTCSHRMPARGAQFPSLGIAPRSLLCGDVLVGGLGDNPQSPQQGLGLPFSCRKGLPPSLVFCRRHLFLLNEPLSRQCSVCKGGIIIPRHRVAGAINSFPCVQEAGRAHYSRSHIVAQGGA